MKFIDTHAHIYLEQFEKDRDEVVERSKESGIHEIYMPNIDHTSIDSMLELEAKFPHQCFAMMGLHPCSVNKDFEKELYLVEEWLSKRPFIALGEIGLDFYWDTTYKDQQKEAFTIQLQWAKEYKIPVVIHCRDSFEETICLTETLKDDDLSGVFHCFTGDKSAAERVIKIDFLLGIGGVATFKNGGLDVVLPDIDLQHIILETDSPYLAPVPYRGKRNEPGFIPQIAKKVADYKDIAIEKLAKKTTDNAFNLFKKSYLEHD